MADALATLVVVAGVEVEEPEELEPDCEPDTVPVLDVVVDDETTEEDEDEAPDTSLAPQTPLFATDAPRVDLR